MGRAQRLNQIKSLHGWGALLSSKNWQDVRLKKLEARVVEHDFAIETLHGRVHGKAGDVILRFGTGAVAVIDAKTFAEQVVPTAPGLTVETQAQQEQK